MGRAHTPSRILTDAVRGHWVLYTFGTLALLVTSLSEVLAPKFIQWALDIMTPQANVAGVPALFVGATRIDTLHQIVIGLTGCLFVGWIGRFLWRQTLARRSHQAGRDLKVGMWEVLRHEPLRTFHRFPLGDLMNRAIGDLHAGRSVHGFTIVVTFDMVFFAVLGAVAMLMIDVELALFCLAVFPFLPRYIIRLAKREYTQHERAQERLSGLSDLISQCLGAIRLQRSTATHDAWALALGQDARDYAEKRFAVLRTGLRMFPLGALPTLIAYAILLFWGVEKIESGAITVGEFVALQSYVLLLQTPLFELGDVISEWQRGFASLARIAEILNLRGGRPRALSGPVPARSADTAGVAGSPNASGNAVAPSPAIFVTDLSFSYTANRPPRILDRVELAILPGEHIGITGAIGTGKTTLLKLISGLLDSTSGRIELLGQSIVGADRSAVTDRVAMVPQRSFLFAGSVRYNLILGEETTISDDDLWRVLAVVSLDADVRAMPRGLDTWIGEWGINLSGGQKQRLALARALLRPKAILLLDDCLSAVDAATEAHILSSIGRELAGRTLIWVAHRASTLKLCSRVYALGDGKLTLLTGEAIEEGGQP